MMMRSLMILHLTTLTFVLQSASDSDLSVCPHGCICRTSGTLDEVTCHALNLTSIPSGLPASVVRIDLANNSLTVLDVSQLHFLRRPAEVVLTGNRIQSIVDSRQPEAATSVQVQILWLGHNRLSALGGPAMGALGETLVQLDLSNNRLSSVEGTFVGCSLLSRLDLRQNLLTTITSTTFRDLVSLRYLRLEDNLISSVSVDAFSRLQHLSYLVLKGNPIGATLGAQTEFRFNTDFLSYLDLSVAEFPTVPLGLPPSVRYLQLRKNRLRVLSRKDFAGMRQLGILILDENEIDEIEEGAFENLVQLSQLWMNGNRLKAVPLRLPSGVQRLLLDSNRIESITDRCFVGLSQVRTLSLMGNSIAAVDVGTFDALPQLTSLDLSGNRISRILPGTFLRNTHIQVLHLSKNPLHSLDGGAFEGLARLDQLSASYIPPSLHSSSFTLDALDDLQRLTRLDLDGSTDVIRALLTSGARWRPLFLGLRDLSLAKSDLSALPSDFLSSLPHLTSFRISSDRWHCDRSLLWLRDYLANSSVAPGDNRCLSPRHVTGRLLTSLADDEFATLGTVTTASGDGRNPLGTNSFLFERTVLTHTSHSQATETIATAVTSRDVTWWGEGVDLRTRMAKTRVKDLPSTHTQVQWLTTGPAQGSHFDGVTDHNPTIQEAGEASRATPKVKEDVDTTQSTPGVARQTPFALSPYSGDDPSSGSFQFFHFNRTGFVRKPTAGDSSQSSVTSDDDVIEQAKGELSVDAIVAIGTVVGTMVTAVVMVSVIVHLCRKEKAGVEPSTVVSGGPKKTPQGGAKEEEQREVVCSTPGLHADVEGAQRRDPAVGGRGRTLGARASGGGQRHSTREDDWPSTGQGPRMSTTSSKAYWDSAASEATSLMHGGRNCGDGTHMRVYRWEEL